MAQRREERPSRRFRKTRRFRDAAQALGARVRQARRAQALTLERAAEKTGLDFRHLQQVEAGTVNVTLATLIRIASGLGIDPSWLLSRETPFDSTTYAVLDSAHHSPAALETRKQRGIDAISNKPAKPAGRGPNPARRGGPVDTNSKVGSMPPDVPPAAPARQRAATPPPTDANDMRRRAGRTIAQLRAGRMTQTELATLTGVSLKYVQRVEAGTQNLTIASLVRFANALGVPPARLLL